MLWLASFLTTRFFCECFKLTLPFFFWVRRVIYKGVTRHGTSERRSYLEVAQVSVQVFISPFACFTNWVELTFLLLWRVELIVSSPQPTFVVRYSSAQAWPTASLLWWAAAVGVVASPVPAGPEGSSVFSSPDFLTCGPGFHECCFLFVLMGLLLPFKCWWTLLRLSFLSGKDLCEWIVGIRAILGLLEVTIAFYLSSRHQGLLLRLKRLVATPHPPPLI